MNNIQTVKLNDEEQALYDAVCWDLDELVKKDDDTRLDHLEKAGQLAELLLNRDVIPEFRVAYFTDPNMNVGGYGKSRQEVFERNGTSGKAILRHPHFFDYLKYFINGPDLPKDMIQGFCKIIEEDHGTSGMVLDQIKSYVRKEVRDKRLSPAKAAEEFFKLTYEIHKPQLAESVRFAAMRARR